ncbi:hypothetical protein BP6252_12766 [Coleophoma cylindrospora]|uniref:Metallo-beta-lactamase domain-containing protein n=1 Tax=Coleophoma cylindrospora TaxID=1849047 RepID=A0A3D8QD08_9HELO|nr:hypothetical protein BP6252_12766 [Coleophoma cylindrospora]
MAKITVPASDSIVRVRAVDTTLKLLCNTYPFLKPVIAGHEQINFSVVAFLVENKALGKTALFDVGGRKDYWNYSPSWIARLRRSVVGIRCDKTIDEVLIENGVDTKDIDAVIWSHWHFDHIGDCSKFPPSTRIVVGPGFKDSFLPGFPTNPEAFVMESDYQGHEMQEISFSDDFKIGPFRAYDFFGDNSFYILDVPGHAVGHICGLARTTPTTFMLFGGDACHFGGAIRPSEHVPLPESLDAQAAGLDDRFSSPCPCSIFGACHPAPTEEEKRKTPYYTASDHPGSAYVDAKLANMSMKGLGEFDADPDMFLCLAHDSALMEVLPLLNDKPDIDVNNWKDAGYKDMTRWRFLNELPKNNGERGRPPLVTGFWRYGERKETFDG